jgi:hypothetical protein
MWTSSTAAGSRSRVRREIVALALAGVCAVLIASPEDPALTWIPLHPMWALAIVLSARYGAPGLWLAPGLLLGLLAADMLGGGSGADVLARLSRGGDLAALATAGVCAALGTAHERRKAVLDERLLEAETRAVISQMSVDELAKIAIALRDRCDRSATSLAFIADVAARIDGSDEAVSSDAALELAMARSGALGGFLQLVDGNGHLRTLASRGPAVLRDLTATAALTRCELVSADAVPGVRPEDSDLAAPLLDDQGSVIGVLALRGLPYAALGAATRADLTAVARWVARTLAPPRRQAEQEARGARGAVYAHA